MSGWGVVALSAATGAAAAAGAWAGAGAVGDWTAVAGYEPGVEERICEMDRLGCWWSCWSQQRRGRAGQTRRREGGAREVEVAGEGLTERESSDNIESPSLSCGYIDGRVGSSMDWSSSRELQGRQEEGVIKVSKAGEQVERGGGEGRTAWASRGRPPSWSTSTSGKLARVGQGELGRRLGPGKGCLPRVGGCGRVGWRRCLGGGGEAGASRRRASTRPKTVAPSLNNNARPALCRRLPKMIQI